MGVFDQNYTRLGILLFCFIFLTCIYTAEYVAFGVAKDIHVNTDVSLDVNDVNTSSTESVRENVDTSGIDLFGMINFMTFTLPEIPDWQKAIFAPIATIFLIVTAYLTIDITYDIIKALPFT